MNPKVSIIMSAYNTEAYIEKAIDSALSQTEQSFELIIVDNGSTDRTGEVVKKYKDSRIKLITLKENVGFGAARNLATQAARGQWVAILDSDDWYTPDRLQKLIEVAESHNADVVIDNLYFILDKSETPWSTLIAESGRKIENPLQISAVEFAQTDIFGRKDLHLGLSKPIIRTSFLMQHQLEYLPLTKAVDLDFWFTLSCLAHGAFCILVPEPYYFLRTRESSMMTTENSVRLEKSIEVAQIYLEKQVFKSNLRLLRALSVNLATFKRYRAYYRIVEALKEKKYTLAISKLWQNPQFFIVLAIRLPGILHRWTQYYVLGDKSQYETAHLRN